MPRGRIGHYGSPACTCSKKKGAHHKESSPPRYGGRGATALAAVVGHNRGFAVLSPKQEKGEYRWPPLFSQSAWLRIVRRLRLSKRQAEVAALLGRECLVREIAAELGISPDSVRHHCKVLFKRLGVKSRLGVVLRLVHESRINQRAKTHREN